MALKVIGLVGLQGSGKSEVARILEGFGIPQVRMGDVVLDELRRRGEAITEESAAKMASEIRRLEGMGAIARRCVDLIRVKGEGKGAVVVDGIRGMAEVEEFRKAFGNGFFLWAVWARQSIRYERIHSRAREDDALTMEHFQKRDRRELGFGLGEAMALADEMILNEGTLEELQVRVSELFHRVFG